MFGNSPYDDGDVVALRGRLAELRKLMGDKKNEMRYEQEALLTTVAANPELPYLSVR